MFNKLNLYNYGIEMLGCAAERLIRLRQINMGNVGLI